jgi:hypothetical protein
MKIIYAPSHLNCNKENHFYLLSKNSIAHDSYKQLKLTVFYPRTKIYHLWKNYMDIAFILQTNIELLTTNKESWENKNQIIMLETSTTVWIQVNNI